MSCGAAERGKTGKWAPSRRTGFPTALPNLGSQRFFLWHPAEQTPGTMPGWQGQPRTRAQTLLGVSG